MAKKKRGIPRKLPELIVPRFQSGKNRGKKTRKRQTLWHLPDLLQFVGDFEDPDIVQQRRWREKLHKDSRNKK